MHGPAAGVKTLKNVYYHHEKAFGRANAVADCGDIGYFSLSVENLGTSMVQTQTSPDSDST